MEIVDSVLQRLKILKEIREPRVARWKEGTDFVLGGRGDWELESEEGRYVPPRNFSSYANWALKLMANGVIGNMMSPSFPFFKIRPPQIEVWRAPNVGTYIEAAEVQLYAELARGRFYQQAVEYCRDLFTVGHAVSFIFEDKAQKRVVFSTRHPKESYIAIGPGEEPDTNFREFREQLGTLIRTFGKEKFPEELISRAEKDPYQRVTVVHAVFPREERDYTSWMSTSKPFASYYILPATKTILEESGYDEFPYAISRMDTNSGEVYATSPTLDALSDIKMINQMARTRINLAQFVSDPPFNIPQSLEGDPELVPHGYNYYPRVNEIISPIQMGANYPINVDVEQRTETIINRHFNVDFFQMLQASERQMTAREVMERQGEKAAALTPITSAITNGFLVPTLKRTFAIMVRQGRIEPPPKELMDAGGLPIDFIGPLAQLQRRAIQGDGVLSSIEVLGALMQMNPEVMDKIQIDNLLLRAMDATSLPQDVIRSDGDTMKLRKDRAAQQQAMQQQAVQAQQQELLYRNMDRLNKPKNPQSILSEMEQKAQMAQQSQKNQQAGIA